VRESRWLILSRETIQNLTDFEKGYIAGIIDGEGSLIIEKGKNRKNFDFCIRITNTSVTVIEWLRRRIGGNILSRKPTAYKNTLGKKTIYVLTIDRQADLVKLLTFITPYLIIKRRQAEIMLKLLRAKLSRPIREIVHDRKGRIIATKYTEPSKEEMQLFLEYRQLTAKEWIRRIGGSRKSI